MKNSLIKITATLALIVASTITISAQDTSTNSNGTKFGIKGGVNFSNLYSDDVDDENVLTGFNLGLYAKLPITDFIAVQPEISYTTKGAELVYNNAFADGTARFKLGYIEVPVVLVFDITENFNIHAGPYFGYLIDGKVTNESNGGTFDFEENLDEDDFNRFDAGIAAGVGFDFGTIGVGARYNYGLTNVGKERTYGGSDYTFPDAKNSVLNVYVTFGLN